jgi:hypothetical protein
MRISRDNNQDDLRDEDIDVSEIPEMNADFFEKAVLNRPGDVLLTTISVFRKKHGLS